MRLYWELNVLDWSCRDLGSSMWIFLAVPVSKPAFLAPASLYWEGSVFVECLMSSCCFLDGPAMWFLLHNFQWFNDDSPLHSSSSSHITLYTSYSHLMSVKCWCFISNNLFLCLWVRQYIWPSNRMFHSISCLSLINQNAILKCKSLIWPHCVPLKNSNLKL